MGETKKHYPTAEDLAISYLFHLQAKLLHEENELCEKGKGCSEFIKEYGLIKAKRFHLRLKCDRVSSDPRIVEEYSVREIARRNLLMDKEKRNNQ